MTGSERLAGMRKLISLGTVLVLLVPLAARGQTQPATTRSSADDAAPIYRQAFAAVATLNEEDSGWIGLCGKEGCWVVNTPLDQETRALLKGQQATISLVRRA